ncbi:MULTISPECIES: helix-turn-helix domain-containing protein [unclassified Shinella]|uniref:helix-turn-helix domain-containing protein n=1 Tax=unclassified Shinella TaxID=2643062 RepID=UPI00225CD5EA|nr:MULTISPECIES: helix-turn-helix domain-containing protein [unclassified Shinella]MCO5139037.1 helix-turn-helix domain-containing protein [Shinella sp.]MDC7256234.1 helix-turn-helix domain-containing protein [Shinella sp. YE25]CAI0339092.1 HTH_35 domain-containing protein [Rhizobiaceae bacterium]CAK7257508.1 Ner family transcriptional regulator [Shinella sp. WSC3-e]
MHPDRHADKAAAARLEEAHRVKSKLSLAGFSLLDVDRLYNLPRGTAGTTLREPNAAGERAIAAALQSRPHLLWRSRYHADGHRKSPQPAENYQRSTMRERRQAQAADCGAAA